MPMLVRTPEEIFRAEKRDIYVLITQESVEEIDGVENFIWSSTEMPEGLLMIQAWLKDHMPSAKQELLAPSEYSGVICGGIGGQIRVDFSPEQLKAFCDRWEVNDKSIDPRFQCCIYPYRVWYDRHGHHVPTLDQPTAVGVSVWWYTPLGFIHHQLSEAEAQDTNWNRHPANHLDIWAQAIQRWPVLAALDTEHLCYGKIKKFKNKTTWSGLFSPPWSDQDETSWPTEAQIRHWFHLPADAEVVEDCP